jgi:hypothetical protein
MRLNPPKTVVTPIVKDVTPTAQTKKTPKNNPTKGRNAGKQRK